MTLSPCFPGLSKFTRIVLVYTCCLSAINSTPLYFLKYPNLDNKLWDYPNYVYPISKNRIVSQIYLTTAVVPQTIVEEMLHDMAEFWMQSYGNPLFPNFQLGRLELIPHEWRMRIQKYIIDWEFLIIVLLTFLLFWYAVVIYK